MRATYDRRTFAFPQLPGWPWHRQANRFCMHTDGNPNPHTAASALAWGNRERAFSIHMYVDGEIGFWCIPPDWQAFHIRRADIAAAQGFRTTWPGLSRPRGDILTVGAEHVMRADGTWSQDTRITSVLMAAELFGKQPQLLAAVSEHADWDPTDRAFDVGDALWIPDWILDVKDVLSGRTPYRTVGVVALPEPFVGSRPEGGEHPPIHGHGDIRQQIAGLAAALSSTRAGVKAVDGRVDNLEARADRHLAP